MGIINNKTFKLAQAISILLYLEDSKESYLDRILNINNLFDKEGSLWSKYKDIISSNDKSILTLDKISYMFNIKKVSDDMLLNLKKTYHNCDLEHCIYLYEQLYQQIQISDNLLDLSYNIRDSNKIDNDNVINIIEALSKNNTEKIFFDINEELRKSYKEQIDNRKISTCINQIDNLGASFRKGTINSVMAYTGCFKTMYCTNLSLKALKDKFNVCYISLEISKTDMYYNFLSSYSNESKFSKKICHTEIKFHELSKDDENYLFNTLIPDFSSNLGHRLIIVDETDLRDESFAEFDTMFRNVENHFIEDTGSGVDMIVIDHINLLKFSNTNAMNDYSKVNYWMSYFRKNCINFINKNKKVCFMVAVQTSRDGFNKAKSNNGQYSLTGAAEGNEIERSSENVISIYADAETKENNEAKFQLIKGRNCGEMTIPIDVMVDPKYYLIPCEIKSEISNENIVTFNNITEK
jgi:replicative DNA helicase